MLSIMILFLLLSSGSVYMACFHQKNYEEVLPLTCMGSILILFLSGILGSLKMGLLVLFLLCAVLYGAAAIHCFRQKNLRQTAQKLLTPGFFIFLFFNILFYFCIKGKLITSWDEFTHWGDIVKVMVTLDDFGTNPASHSLFKSYPPAMALFQYLLQKITGFLYGIPLTEWQLYFSYQLLTVALYLPFSKELCKSRLSCLLFAAVLFFMPAFLFSDYYSSIYIDAFLGLLSGAGFAMILLDRSRLHSCYVCMVCALLVLTKDAGMIFAVFLAVTYAADSKAPKKTGFLLSAALASASVLVPKLLWEWNIARNQAFKNFSGKVDIAQLLQVMIGKDTSYRTDVYHNFMKRYTVPVLTAGRLPAPISHLLLLVTLALLTAFVFRTLVRKNILSSRKAILVFSAVFLQTILYSFGLCVMFMFKFTEFEALALASCSRYLAIAFQAVWSLLLLSALTALGNTNLPTRAFFALAMAGILLLTTPSGFLSRYLQRSDAESSVSWRERFDPYADLIREKTEDSSRIYFLSQESDGYLFYLMRYISRPRYLANTEHDSSVGVPFYQGDIYTKVIEPEVWLEELLENYDYLALYETNGYFTETFRPYCDSEITPYTIYRTDPDSGKLIKCE